MSISSDISVVRELAKRYMEIAQSERYVRMRKRFRDSNDLKIVRPPVIIEEVPWHEMNYEGALDCVCKDASLRGMEYGLRVALLRDKYLACDNFIEPVWVVYKAYRSTGMGFEITEKRLAVDARNHIVSHRYEDVLADDAALEAYHDPVITADPEGDAARVARMEEILGGVMPVELRGNYIYYAPWDRIAMLRGVEPICIDMYERPEHLHKIIGLFTRAMKCEMDQMEALGMYDPRGINLHCTPAYVTPPKPSDGASEGKYSCRDIWFRTMAQMFSMVSPAAHYEFDVAYSLPLAERCAYTYYGCCEPLHDRLDVIMRYPNLRKIGVTPWADLEASAEAIGNRYVLSRKPNPAYVALTADPEIIRDEISETARICLKYGCPCDITLKDISTVNYDPRNLMIWAKTVSEVLDEYYGAD
ncbi:MAG: hypothetical protein GX628_04630 [Clostridiales bacterium]|nr:hypothetical protein [Clostridiales bacterium]